MFYIELYSLLLSGRRWIIKSTHNYLFLSKLTTAKAIPQSGWIFRNTITNWQADETLTVKGNPIRWIKMA